MILLVVLYNWFIIFVMFNLFIPSPLPGLCGSLIVIVLLIWSAHTAFLENLLRWTSGLRPALLEESLKIDSIVCDLSRKANLVKSPDIYIADYSFPNAYAIGKHTIGVTKGLLETATMEELFAVLAHEIGHLKHGDSARHAIAMVLNAGGIVASWVILHVFRFQSFSIFPVPSGMFDLTFAVCVAVIYLFAGVIKWYFGVGFRVVGPKEEYKADYFVVQAGGGKGFISFLHATSSVEFSKKGGLLGRAVATHPPAFLRIEQMKKRMAEIKID